MGGAVRKHLYEKIRNSELLMSAKGMVVIAVVSVGYMMLAFVKIHIVLDCCLCYLVLLCIA